MIRYADRLKWIVASALALAATSVSAGQITLFERQNFQGRSITTSDGLAVVQNHGLGNAASSIIVGEGVWLACSGANFDGRCIELMPGNYAAIDVQVNGRIASVRPLNVSPLVINAQPVVVSPAPVVANAQPIVVNPPAIVVSPQSVVTTGPPVVVVPQPIVVGAQPATVAPVDARLVLYERGWFGTRRSVELTTSIQDLRNVNFNERANGALVAGGVWRLCDGTRSQCLDFGPGNYDSLSGLDGRVASAQLVAAAPERVVVVTPSSTGRVVLYEYPNFGGSSVAVDRGQAKDLDWARFTSTGNRATSIRVESGTWLVCSEIGFAGECRTLGPGEYPQLSGTLVAGIASARQVSRPEYGMLGVYSR